MVVRIQTAEGKIREYKTSSCLGKYSSKCATEYGRKDCDHLECAIGVAKRERDAGPGGFMLFLSFAGMIIQFSGDQPRSDVALILSGLLTIFAFLF